MLLSDIIGGSRILDRGDFGNPSERSSGVARIWLEEGHKTTSK